MFKITNLISHFAGRAAYCKLPAPFSTLSVKAFAKFYKIDVAEAAKSISEYRTIGDFFIRDLKPDARVIENGVVSPVDGRLRNFGKIEDDTIEQVKGRNYSISDLVSDKRYADHFMNGDFFNLYLSPQNYHHIHAPFGGEIIDVIHVAGSLLPVNDWALNRYDNLFTRNERLIVILKTDLGLLAVIMVAALNVGGISLQYKEGVSGSKILSAGDKMATFKLGSTVVLLFEPDRITPLPLKAGQLLRYGESIATIKSV